MARTLSITVPSERRAAVIDALVGEGAVIGISVQPSASAAPPGDVITLTTTNGGAAWVLESLDRLGDLDRCHVVLSEPAAVLAGDKQALVDAESNEGVWEEMASLLRRDTNVGFNYLALMATSGAIAAMGLLTDTLHIVVGAMLLAPGFEPFMRMAFGGLGRGQKTTAVSGLKSVLAGYAALALGAAAWTALAVGAGLWQGRTGDLRWLSYWTQTDLTAPMIAIPAAIGGVAVIASRRTTFAAGVMVALALVPGMAILGMGLVLGEGRTATLGLARWAADAASVLAAGFIVLGFKRIRKHHHRARD